MLESKWPCVHDTVELCEHVAAQQRLILKGRREAPTFPGHSGWRFECDAVALEPTTGVKIWSVKKLITVDPTICYIIDSPYGTTVERGNLDEEWIVSRADSSVAENIEV
jgi:hypothetical protein